MHADADAFRRWVQGIQHVHLMSRQYVVVIRLEAEQRARTASNHDLTSRRRSWRTWLQEGPAKGLGRQHRMSRTVGGWVPSPVGRAATAGEIDDDFAAVVGGDVDLNDGELTEMPLHAQHEVDSEAMTWAAVWQANAHPPGPAWPPVLGQAMPPLCVSTAMRACNTFPAGTCLGWDSMHPRALTRISEGAIAALLRIFMLAELVGQWPQMIGIVIIALLPDAGGGSRPIGLCPSLIRLWMRLRLSVAQAWQTANDRPYFFAGEAKGADVAAWKQAARAEISAYEKLGHALALLDIIKAFDGVPWDWLVKQATARKYNLWLLRLSLAVYALARTIRVGKCHSVVIRALCGITHPLV